MEREWNTLSKSKVKNNTNVLIKVQQLVSRNGIYHFYKILDILENCQSPSNKISFNNLYEELDEIKKKVADKYEN